MSEPIVLIHEPTIYEQMDWLDNTLTTLSKKAATSIARKSLRKGALVVRRKAKELAPVGKSYTRTVAARTVTKGRGKKKRRVTHAGATYRHEGGTLKSKGVVVSRGRFGTKHVTSMLVKIAKREKLGVPLAEKWYYPAIVDYGVKRGPRRFAGKRFMWRALESAGKDAAEECIEQAWRLIEQEVAASRSAQKSKSKAA